jgi:Fe-S-cluster-containing hydrogenase component 2
MSSALQQSKEEINWRIKVSDTNMNPFIVDFKDIEIKCGYPSKERLEKGPVVVIECPEEIPCNPCETICPKNVITVGKPITNIPVVDEDKCDGCGICIPICPGLAVFIVDETYSTDKAAITIPYEILPLPDKGEVVDALDRNGNVVCAGEIIKIKDLKMANHTFIVTIAVPKEYSKTVRNFKRQRS